MQNKGNIESIDQLFSSRLLNHKIVPPPEVWDGIATEMDAQKRKKRALWIITFSSAASLLLAFLAGWYFSEKDTGTENQVAKEIRSFQQEKDIAEKEDVAYEIDEKNLPVEMIAENNQPDKYQQPEKYNETFASKKDKLVILEKLEKDPVSETKTGKLDFIKPLKIFLLKADKPSPRLIAMNTGGFSEADRKIIEANLRNMPKEIPENKKAEWLVGLQASPAYRFEEGSAQSEKADIIYNVNQSGTATKYITNMTGGVKFEYKNGKRFSIQSGVNYGEIVSSNGTLGVSFLGHNWLNNFLYSEEVYYVEDPEVNNIPESDNTIVATNIGLASIEMPEGTELALSDRGSENFYISEVIQSAEFEQQAGYIEVPLIVCYSIIQKKIGLYVLGGINTNFLTSNSVELVSNNEVVGSGKIEGLNPLTFSSSLGMGLNYTLGKHFNLSVEPTMKIMLNSLNSEAIYETRPYTVGVYTALSYRF